MIIDYTADSKLCKNVYIAAGTLTADSAAERISERARSSIEARMKPRATCAAGVEFGGLVMNGAKIIMPR